MSSSEIGFKIWLEDNLPRIVKDYRNFDGNVIVLSDEHKDELCYNFLLNFHSWWDDVLPPVTACRLGFLDELYNRSLGQNLSEIIRNDIYLYLELHLNDVVTEVYNEVFNIKPEPFAGYERGQ
jgi:hypothetical protein